MFFSLRSLKVNRQQCWALPSDAIQVEIAPSLIGLFLGSVGYHLLCYLSKCSRY